MVTRGGPSAAGPRRPIRDGIAARSRMVAPSDHGAQARRETRDSESAVAARPRLVDSDFTMAALVTAAAASEASVSGPWGRAGSKLFKKKLFLY
jgi:hypothetical protein